MFRQTLEISDGQVKIIQDKINIVENNFSKLCSSYGAYCRKLAMLRDKGDDIAKYLKEYAAAETMNRSLRSGIDNFSNCLSSIEDYRQAQIERIEVKVIGQLAPYENICKTAKDNVKTALKARTREVERRRQLQKARTHAPQNRQEISLAESELTKATVDATQTLKQLEELMDNFEQKKLKDIQHILLEYTNIQLLFHVKAIEIYTQAFNHIKSINDEEDLREFRDCLKLSPTGTNHLDLVRSIAESSPSHRPSNLSTTRGSSLQSLVGQLQALRDKNNEGPENSGEEDDDSNTNDDESLSSSISSIHVPETRIKRNKRK